MNRCRRAETSKATRKALPNTNIQLSKSTLIVVDRRLLVENDSYCRGGNFFPSIAVPA